jgi:gamma-glutamyl:cysteine ligase YbdK (ATP-grasp superfamily)
VRQAIAAAATPKRAARALPKITIEQVLAVLEDVERIGREAPRQARDVLATAIEPVILNPHTGGLRGREQAEKQNGHPRERPSSL